MRKVGHSIIHAKLAGVSREEWLVLRSAGIGGSDVAQISGVSKWGNPLKVYLSKIDPLHDNGEQSEAAAIGTAIEDFVAQLWMERNPEYKLERVNAILRHPDYPWAMANIDRVVIDRVTNKVVGIYEGKTAGMKTDWQDDAIPDDYYLQGQWYLAVTGMPKIFYGALLGGFGGLAMADRVADADPDLHNNLFTIGEQFWHKVTERTPPAIDGSQASDDVLKHLYPTADDMGPTIELPAGGDLKAAAFLDAKAVTKAAELEEKRLGNELKLLMEDAGKATCPGFNLSWSNITANRFDAKRFAADHPDLHAEYLKESSYRRFTVKELK